MKLFLVLHHSADPSQKPQFEKVNAVHRNRGYPKSRLGYFVGYHWFVGFDGTTKQARHEDETGAHCNAKLMNYVGIGVCLAGDFTVHQPSAVQIEALERLVWEIQQRHGIPDANIMLHRECKATSCPGIDLRELLLVQRARRALPKQNETLSDRVKAMLGRRLSRRATRLTR